jgi:hypothetical protein
MIYLWKKNGAVYHHTNRAAAALLDGLTEAPDMEISEAEYEAAGGLARLVKGVIVLGKTDAEKKAEENERKIAVLKLKLADTDYISAKIAEGSATTADYAKQIAQRQAWRQEIATLSA